MSRNRKNQELVVDENGIEIATEVAPNNTVEKRFKISRTQDWPTDDEGKPVELSFDAVIDMSGVNYNAVLGTAIRSKVIDIQRALRTVSYESLVALKNQGALRRHFDNCGIAPEDAAKTINNVKASFSTLTPEQQRKLMAEWAAQYAGT